MKISELDMRDAFIKQLHIAADNGEDIYFLSDDFGSAELEKFKKVYPKRVINAGIAEQSIISIAAGLALEGKKVFVYAIAPFIPHRCFEQIKLDLCCMELPVALISVGAGYGYSSDGPTHHSTEDIGVLRPLAKLDIYSPSDADVAGRIASALCLSIYHPTYIRLDRGKTTIYDKPFDMTCGLRIFGNNFSTIIICTGTIISEALKAKDNLAKSSINVSVVDLFKIKPLPSEQLCHILLKAHNIITLEEHSEIGGLGSAIAEIVTEILPKNLVHFKRMGLKEDKIYTYGNREDLRARHQIDSGSVQSTIEEWCER